MTQSALRVLVAEDNFINQKLAVAALKGLGHTGVVVPDGVQALQALAQREFDLVLMDVMMPNMDGKQALAAIREKERQTGGPRMPVFMVTANDLPGDRQRYMLSGADGYVAKPLDVALLQAEIARVFPN